MPVTCRTKLPVEPVGVVVNPIAELPTPLGGGVTVCGIVIPIPVGALPIQEVEKDTGALKPPRELTSMLVPPLRP